MIKTIGCCDSGIGGMVVVNAFKKAYPDADIVYIADQKNVPYGDKTKEELTQYARNLLSTFRQMKIKDVIVACNTLCANVLDDLLEEYSDLHIYSIIKPTAHQIENKNYKNITVLATSATVDKHAYKEAIHEISKETEVHEIKAVELVPLIENGASKNELLEAVKRLNLNNDEAILLGCTHYPLIRPFLKNVDVYDSNEAIIHLFKNERFEGNGKLSVYTSAYPEKMKKNLHDLFDLDVDVQLVELERS